MVIKLKKKETKLEKIEIKEAKEKDNRKSNLSKTLVLGVVGIILAIIPATFNKAIGILVGLSLLVVGLATIFQYIQNKIGSHFNLICGILYAVLGAFVMLYPGYVIKLVAICLGVYLLITGLLKLSVAFSLKDVNKKWIGTLIIAILIMVLGLLLIFDPFSGVAITKLSGIFLVIVAAFDLIDTYILQR